jgi:hypothetical protein
MVLRSAFFGDAVNVQAGGATAFNSNATASASSGLEYGEERKSGTQMMLEICTDLWGVLVGMMGMKAAQMLDVRKAHQFYIGAVLLTVMGMGAAASLVLDDTNTLGSFGPQGARGSNSGSESAAAAAAGAAGGVGVGAGVGGARKGEAVSNYFSSFLGVLVNFMFWFLCMHYAKQYRDVLLSHVAPGADRRRAVAMVPMGASMGGDGALGEAMDVPDAPLGAPPGTGDPIVDARIAEDVSRGARA